MKDFSQRRVFVGLMTVLATLFGTAYGVYELRGHADLFADTLKISGLLALTSACISYGCWTAAHLRGDSDLRGAAAGLLTAVMIIPIPYFASTLKAEFFRLYSLEHKGIFGSVLEAMPRAIAAGLETFQLISKVSLAAIIASIILGAGIARLYPLRANNHAQLRSKTAL